MIRLVAYAAGVGVLMAVFLGLLVLVALGLLYVAPWWMALILVAILVLSGAEFFIRLDRRHPRREYVRRP